MKTLVAGGIEQAVVDRGSGPVLLLVHGFPLDHTMWNAQSDALSGQYRVVAPDLRGFGESAVTGPYTMSQFADDLIALLDQLDIENPVIGGMSMGGYVLLNLLERYPGRAAGALFLMTRAGADDEEGRARRTRLAHEVQERGPGIVAEAFESLLFTPETLQNRPDLVEQVRSWMVSTNPHGLEGALLAMRDRKDFNPDLPLLDVPSLVVAGEKDQIVSLDVAQDMKHALPRADFCIVPKAGHLANMENPNEFNRCLVDFLESLDLS